MPSTGSSKVGRLLCVVVLALGLAGCGQNPMAPVQGGGAPGPQPAAGSPPPILTTPGAPAVAAPQLNASPEAWYQIAGAWVDADQDETVGGGRYELHFFLGSLREGAQITIQEWDSHVLEFELGPHGTTFDVPVELRIDYSGTNADPGSSSYDGSVPELWWLNDQTGVWEQVPGVLDEQQLKVRCKLSHFSRYSLRDGRAGW